MKIILPRVLEIGICRYPTRIWVGFGYRPQAHELEFIWRHIYQWTKGHGFMRIMPDGRIVSLWPRSAA